MIISSECTNTPLKPKQLDKKIPKPNLRQKYLSETPKRRYPLPSSTIESFELFSLWITYIVVPQIKLADPSSATFNEPRTNT